MKIEITTTKSGLPALWEKRERGQNCIVSLLCTCGNTGTDRRCQAGKKPFYISVCGARSGRFWRAYYFYII